MPLSESAALLVLGVLMIMGLFHGGGRGRHG